MIVSTGGATLEDVDRAMEAIAPINDQICLLQCTAAYPAAVEELNLAVITTLRERYPDVVVGLSDHQDGIAMATVAYMLGARVIEKHFTLSHAAKGTDHAFSLIPEGMRKLVRDLRRVPVAMGDGEKRPLPSEEKPLEKMGKKLVATRALAGRPRARAGRPRGALARGRGAAAVRARRARRPPARAAARRGRGDPRRRDVVRAPTRRRPRRRDAPAGRRAPRDRARRLRLRRRLHRQPRLGERDGRGVGRLLARRRASACAASTRSASRT